MSANRTLQFSVYAACASCGVSTSQAFTVKALSLTMGASGAVPLYLSLQGTATTSDCYVSTGQSLFWPSLPSGTDVVSLISTSSGAEYSLTVFG